MSDLISRQAAIDAIERLILPQTKGETMAEEINRVAWRCAINCAEEMIGHLPSIEPVKHGEWRDYPIADGCLQCSICGVLRIGGPSNFCPNCGAKMDAEEAETKDEP